MPAKDKIHEAVCNALDNDDWIITDDPLTLEYEDKRVYPDLGAQRPIIGAERGEEKIAVEIKGFLSRSIMHDLQDALGQYTVYLAFLERVEPDRKLYLATTEVAYNTLYNSAAIRMLLDVYKVSLIVIDIEKEEVIEWIPS